MKISYKPLWQTMQRKQITSYRLIKDYKFSSRTINNLRHNVSITMHTLAQLCEILDCTPNDIVEFLPEDNQV